MDLLLSRFTKKIVLLALYYVTLQSITAPIDLTNTTVEVGLQVLSINHNPNPDLEGQCDPGNTWVPT